MEQQLALAVGSKRAAAFERIIDYTADCKLQGEEVLLALFGRFVLVESVYKLVSYQPLDLASPLAQPLQLNSDP